MVKSYYTNFEIPQWTSGQPTQIWGCFTGFFLQFLKKFTILLSEEENKSVSHEDVNNKLRQKELEESQKLVKFIADKFQSFGKPLQPGPYSMCFEFLQIYLSTNQLFFCTLAINFLRNNLLCFKNMTFLLCA